MRNITDVLCKIHNYKMLYDKDYTYHYGHTEAFNFANYLISIGYRFTSEQSTICKKPYITYSEVVDMLRLNRLEERAEIEKIQTKIPHIEQYILSDLSLVDVLIACYYSYSDSVTDRIFNNFIDSIDDM